MRRMSVGNLGAVCVMLAACMARGQAADFVGPRQDTNHTQPAEDVPAESTPPDGAQHPAAVESRPLGIPATLTGSPASLRDSRAGSTPNDIKTGPGWWRTAGALSLVVVVILAIAAIVRRLAGRSSGLMHAIGAGGRAPSGLLQVLGRYPVGRGQTLVLFKLDRRVLLVCQSGGVKGAGMRTLCEVTDPEEVASILLHAAEAEGRSLSSRFRDMVSGFDDEHESGQPQVYTASGQENEPFAVPSSSSYGHDPVQQLSTRLESIRERRLEVSA